MKQARRVFRIGSWAALAATIVMAATVAATVYTGVQALAGHTTYPVEHRLGPLTFRDTLSTGVAAGGDVCQVARVDSIDGTPDCNNFFLSADSETDVDGAVRRQAADVHPVTVRLTGEVQLASSGGWSNFVAAQLVKKVLVGVGVVAWLAMVWRLLAAAAAGTAFSPRTVRLLRGLGWLTIAGAALAPLLSHYTSIVQTGYGAQSFGEEMMLAPWDGASTGVDFVQIALGVLVLLVAEVFRHGADIENEQRLTV
ncbi:Protein of unknown function [Paraoerskovia marina]|uniref:DUF2975 domain-containing protein n=1 Tax=Paraoerskovia marina TaxID=545619 RepID=A0A1H1SPB6_9CELL|nr:DUF2975 domain-containing protein [Paraoerskovia marina]SDS49805.1 Protein of unknown function [Paraoerskovia marina]